MKHSRIYKIPSHVLPWKWFDVGLGDMVLVSWGLWGMLGVLGELEWSTEEKFSPLLISAWLRMLPYFCLSSPETHLMLDSHHSLAGRPPAAFHQPLCAPQLHCWVHLYSPSTIICRDSHRFPVLLHWDWAQEAVRLCIKLTQLPYLFCSSH